MRRRRTALAWLAARALAVAAEVGELGLSVVPPGGLTAREDHMLNYWQTRSLKSHVRHDVATKRKGRRSAPARSGLQHSASAASRRKRCGRCRARS
jgi:hypothetical protein